MQCRIEQFTGDATCERTTGPVGSLFAWRESDHEQFGVQRTEGRDRPRVPVWIAPADDGEVLRQARAGGTVLWIVE